MEVVPRRRGPPLTLMESCIRKMMAAQAEHVAEHGCVATRSRGRQTGSRPWLRGGAGDGARRRRRGQEQTTGLLRSGAHRLLPHTRRRRIGSEGAQSSQHTFLAFATKVCRFVQNFYLIPPKR